MTRVAVTSPCFCPKRAQVKLPSINIFRNIIDGSFFENMLQPNTSIRRNSPERRMQFYWKVYFHFLPSPLLDPCLRVRRGSGGREGGFPSALRFELNGPPTTPFCLSVLRPHKLCRRSSAVWRGLCRHTCVVNCC